MARIPATRKQLKDSFMHHYLAYKSIGNNATLNPITKRLILFYSVESGLKCFLLNKIQKNTTKDLENHPEYNNSSGHNIRELIKFAKIGDQNSFQLKSYVSQKFGKIEPEQLHQIWRYGIKLDDLDYESKSEKILQNVAIWLEARI
jgi:hypothetical protein